MLICEGLFDNMVMQRSGNDCCNQTIAGSCDSRGQIFFRVSHGKCPLQYKKWIAAGRASRGRFKAKIKGLPVGGPYMIELYINSRQGHNESVAVNNVLVGDVWILGGQSNMEGYGILSMKDRSIPSVRSFYMNDVWDIAREPLHHVQEAVDEVHKNLIGINPPKRDTRKGAGLGLYFGISMYNAISVPQGLIACAHGGTSMEQWSPDGKRLKSKSLYGAMLRRVYKNGGKVAGLLWYQGCSDTSDELCAVYTQRMIRFVKSLRRDLNNPRLLVVIAQISRVCGTLESITWNSIQEQQRRLSEYISHLAVVPTIDLAMDDGIHIDHESSVRLGNRFCQAALSLGNRKFKKYKTFDLRKVSVLHNTLTNCADLKLKFNNVIGCLHCDGKRAEGFSLLDKKLSDVKCIYKTVCDKDTVLLKTQIEFEEIGNYHLAYGNGCNPYCNITDEADRSLPVFTGVALGRPMLITDFIKTFHISKLLDVKGSPDYVTVNDKSMKWKQKVFKDDFANMHDLFAQHVGKMQRLFYACRIQCKEDMQLAFHLGYDGPVRFMIDEYEIFSDPNGTNPAKPRDAVIPHKLASGTHELIISLDSNLGAAYGIFLRIERIVRGNKSLRLDLEMPQIAI